MIEADQKDTIYKDYSATCLEMILKQTSRMCGIHIEIPRYIELVYKPEEYMGEQKTKDEIIQSILDRLGAK